MWSEALTFCIITLAIVAGVCIPVLICILGFRWAESVRDRFDVRTSERRSKIEDTKLLMVKASTVVTDSELRTAKYPRSVKEAARKTAINQALLEAQKLATLYFRRIPVSSGSQGEIIEAVFWILNPKYTELWSKAVRFPAPNKEKSNER